MRQQGRERCIDPMHGDMGWISGQAWVGNEFAVFSGEGWSGERGKGGAGLQERCWRCGKAVSGAEAFLSSS